MGLGTRYGERDRQTDRQTDRQIRKRNGGREKGARRYQDIYVGDDKGERCGA